MPGGNMSPNFSMKPLKLGVRPSMRCSSIAFSSRTMSRTRERSWPCICWIEPFMPWNIWSTICFCSLAIRSSNFWRARSSTNS